MNVTPDFISFLKPNEIFVYGANERFIHGAGAARTALEKFGAKMRLGPFCGQSYGICTKSKTIQTLSIPEIRVHVDEFLSFVSKNTQYNFLVTPIGTGLAGYEAQDIAPLFEKALNMENVYLPQEFVNIIKNVPNRASRYDLRKDYEQ